MKKILITSTNSVAGSLILNGFAAGFRANNCFVVRTTPDEISIDGLKKLNPDIVLGFDYGIFQNYPKEIQDYLLDENCKTKLVHYFSDEPNSPIAYTDKPELYKEFCETVKNNPKIINFVWDKDFAKTLPNSYYMPLAVNYKAYRPDVAKKYDISFVGRPLSEKRQRILAALVKKFGKKLNIFCYEHHFLQSLDDMKNRQMLNEDELDIYKSAYRGFLTTESELADVYYNSKVNINMTLQGKSGLNYRVFEVPASQGFLLTDDVADIEKNFIPSKDLETYKNIDELIDKTEFYLKHEDIAIKIAIMGYACVTKCHSFTARARMVLDTVKKINQAH